MNTIANPLIEEKLAHLNQLADQWKSRFDIMPDVTLIFSAQNGELYLNDEVICPIGLVNIEGCSIQVESITIGLATNDYVLINIIWPAVGPITTYIEMLPADAYVQEI